ncbi:hypothetical protein GF351_05295 [Candidatus Woesearchaeota archaeon]|nr:hypothetical protein [Candidatus Woesearchaeota archaeon]
MPRRKKEKKVSKEMILTLFIAFIMIASVLGYSILQGDQIQKRKYGDIVLVQRDMSWVAKVNQHELKFRYLPEELQDIEIGQEAVESIRNTYEVDTTSAPDDENKEAIALFQHDLAGLLDSMDIYLRQGFTEENEFDLPIISCANATSSVPVLKLATANSTVFSMQDGCMIAEASSSVGFIKLRDKLMYSLIGISVG